MEGSGVYWYPHQQVYCSAFKTWAGYINAAIDIFFTKEILAVSCAKGKPKKGKNGHHPLDPLVTETLIGRLCYFIPILTGLFVSKYMIDHRIKVSVCWRPRCSNVEIKQNNLNICHIVDNRKNLLTNTGPQHTFTCNSNFLIFSGKVCSRFAKDSPVPSQVVQNINMKCVEVRRPQIIRVKLLCPVVAEFCQRT